jgi:LPS-assembly lipoprotein
MSFAYKSLFILLSVTLLVACGFHLRGTVELSAEITPIFLEQGADSALNRELRALLSQYGKNNLTQTKSEARTVLNIVSVREKKRVVAVDSNGRARQYDLNFILRYKLTGKNIPQVGDDNIRVLQLRRSINFDPENVLAIEHEVETLYNDMRKDSARLILQRLQALGLQAQGESSAEQ